MISAPCPDRPELSELISQSVAAFNALSPERQREMRIAQRKSWVVGETMLSHPEMSRADAEALYDKVVA